MAADTINEGDDDSKCSGFLDIDNDMLSYCENDHDDNEYDDLDDDKMGENYHHTDGCDKFFEGDGEHVEGHGKENDFDEGEWGQEEFPGGGMFLEQGNIEGSARAESNPDMDPENWLVATARSDETIQYPEVSPPRGSKTVQRTTGEYETPRKSPEKSQTINPTLLL
jgi:hypothetical protein